MDNLSGLCHNLNPYRKLPKEVIRFVKKWGFYPVGGGEEPPAPAPPAPAPTTFLDGLPEELKSHPSITKFKDVPSLGKSYIELEKKISAKGVIIPSDGASEQEISDFHKNLGRPDNADGYAFEDIEGLDDRVKPSEESTKAFKEAAHKLGLNPKTAQALRKWYFETQTANLQAFDKATEDEAKETETVLRREWGSKYIENKALAQKVLKAFGEEGLQSFVKEEGSNPALIRFLAKVGAQLSEDKLGQTGMSGLTLSVAEANAKISEIRNNPNHAYHNDQHAEHNEAVAQMRSLYLMANPPENK